MSQRIARTGPEAALIQTVRRRLLAPALLLLTVAACATNPVTGRRQLALISESQEIQMGQQAAAEIAQALGLVEDEALQAYVQRIGAELAAQSERPHLPWTFRVVDDPTPNAFALPGGYIFVTRGLLNLLTNESELAAVIGHEIGHVTARHQVTALSRAQLAQLGVGLGSIFVPQVAQLGNVLGGGLSLLFLHYGRDAERQADELGFRYALTEGYDVREMADVFEALQRASEKEGRSPLPSYLASHPAEAERIEAANARVAALPTPPDTNRLARAQYLGRIDRLAYGENPRAGFFRENAFYHPDLRFRLAFPPGWRYQNTPQAVVAMSPQQDAVLQLRLSQTQGAVAAAQQFAAQQGLQVLQTQRESVQGNPAAVVYFRAQTQQGVLEGIATFVEYGGRTYQFLGYGPAGQFSRYQSLIRQSVGSFGALTDPQLLAVQPNRIQIVRLDRTMSLAEFAQRYPSVVPLEELALINQVEATGATIAAGTLLKRVVTG